MVNGGRTTDASKNEATSRLDVSHPGPVVRKDQVSLTRGGPAEASSSLRPSMPRLIHPVGSGAMKSRGAWAAGCCPVACPSSTARAKPNGSRGGSLGVEEDVGGLEVTVQDVGAKDPLQDLGKVMATDKNSSTSASVGYRGSAW